MTPSVLLSKFDDAHDFISRKTGDYCGFAKCKDLSDWPCYLKHSLCWEASDFANEEQFVYRLSGRDIAEVNSALTHFKNLELDGSELAVDLHHGKGFCVIRGLHSQDYSPEDNIIIFLGISSYIGESRGAQDETGNMLLHIRDAKQMAAPQGDRPARDSNTQLAFHTDQFPDILALQTQGCAAKGGDHIIASSYKVYNEIAVMRPDLLETLTKPDWYFNSKSLFCPPERRALLFNHDRHIIFNFGRIHVMGEEGCDDKEMLPRPTSQQVEALDAVQQLAEKYQLRLTMQTGDLTFINNFGILHARDGFEDDEQNTRHLVRLWLKNKHLAWRLPQSLERGNSRTFNEEIEQIWDIRPTPRLHFTIREKFGP